jgi:hypothetical protein
MRSRVQTFLKGVFMGDEDDPIEDVSMRLPQIDTMVE